MKAPVKVPRIKKNRLIEDLNAVSRIGLGEHGSVTRLVFSVNELRSRQLLVHMMNRAGLDVHIDRIGNIFGRFGTQARTPAVLAGSHLDSVVQGGRYDGPVGVIGALEAVRTIKESGLALPSPVESVCFVGEESSRFGFSTLGSTLVAGGVKMADFANAVDANGNRLEDVLAGFGIDARNLAALKRDPKTLKAYFELHIEQGPILESLKKRIGVVTSIAAPTRFRVVFHGQADHSGTTPMEMRKDALVAAAHLIAYIDEVCRAHGKVEQGRVVGTVGAAKIEPGVINAVPGRAELLVDVRSITAAAKRKVSEMIKRRARRLAREKRMKVELLPIREEDPVAMHPALISLIRTTCEANDVSYEIMPSGAGHDAMQMAKITPTGMIFIPSTRGISHNPMEWTKPADICLGAQLLLEAMIRAAYGQC